MHVGTGRPGPSDMEVRCGVYTESHGSWWLPLDNKPGPQRSQNYPWMETATLGYHFSTVSLHWSPSCPTTFFYSPHEDLLSTSLLLWTSRQTRLGIGPFGRLTQHADARPAVEPAGRSEERETRAPFCKPIDQAWKRSRLPSPNDKMGCGWQSCSNW